MKTYGMFMGIIPLLEDQGFSYLDFHYDLNTKETKPDDLFLLDKTLCHKIMIGYLSLLSEGIVSVSFQNAGNILFTIGFIHNHNTYCTWLEHRNSSWES